MVMSTMRFGDQITVLMMASRNLLAGLFSNYNLKTETAKFPKHQLSGPQHSVITSVVSLALQAMQELHYFVNIQLFC